MAATAGSKFQEISVKHQAGNPPDCDYQRTSETFLQYVIRMQGHSCNPDIGLTESDADYLTRLASYVPAPPFFNESSSYAIAAGSATSVGGLANQLYVITASLANVALSANALPKGTYAITSSWSTNAVNSAPSSTASYLSGAQAVLGGTTNTNLTITNTSGMGIDVRTSTSGYGIYAQGLLSEAVAATQTGVPSGPINRGALSATRAMNNLNGQTVNVAVFTVLDQYGLSSTPLISATTANKEVFQVDYTGSISVSGSKGYTGTVMLAGPVTMSFQGGILTSVA